jgi:hypothetical protein
VDESATTGLATLLGAATDGLTAVLATWLTRRHQAPAQGLSRTPCADKTASSSKRPRVTMRFTARRSGYSRPSRPLFQD